ncbi:MAG TPA: hypothetical protein VGP44_09440 [Gemmatimonadales bacterium]|nr:hypothetical protein [Gemmatimonadales bacterium]
MHLRPRTIALGLGFGWAVAVLVTLTQMGTPVDARCYYGFDPAQPWAADGCFLYSPPVLTVMEMVKSVMPFEAFVFLLRCAELLVLLIFAGPAIGLVLFIPAIAIELNAANINLLIVGAVLMSFRYPWAWAFVVLTKVTPGVGILWFAVRREWRNFAIAMGATLAIAIASRLAAPELWGQYVRALGTENDGSVWLIGWRLPLAALVVAWGARNDHRWALIVAVFLALPRWYFLSPVILVGLFPLVRLPRPLPWSARLASATSWLGRPAMLRPRLGRPASEALADQAPST